MKKVIKELGNLCKIAADLERKWDRAGKDFLGTRITSAVYTETIREYLAAVRRLEQALSDHLVAVTENPDATEVVVQDHQERDHLTPDS